MFLSRKHIVPRLMVLTASTVLSSVALSEPELTAAQQEFMLQETENLQFQGEAHRADPEAKKAEGLAKARANKEIAAAMKQAKGSFSEHKPDN